LPKKSTKSAGLLVPEKDKEQKSIGKAAHKFLQKRPMLGTLSALSAKVQQEGGFRPPGPRGRIGQAAYSVGQELETRGWVDKMTQNLKEEGSEMFRTAYKQLSPGRKKGIDHILSGLKQGVRRRQ
jgi:hypothetical protein